ncbi:MAG: NUDIX domain-containing protein [Gaiella sp.]
MSPARRPDEVVVVVRRPLPQGGLETLVLLRSRERGGYWNLPAGGAEWAEDVAAAAVRELREETGLDAGVKALELDLRYSLLGKTPEERARYGDADTVRLHGFVADAPAGWEPQLDEEHVAHRWCTREEAVALLAYPEPRVAVEAALA